MDDDQRRVVVRAPVTTENLAYLRTQAINLAHAAGLDDDRAAGFAVAVSEVATNSITHAGGTGEITLAQDDAVVLYAAIVDHGPGMSTEAPTRPPVGSASGRGLWISQEFTDGLRIDSGPDGTTVRLEMALGPRGGDPRERPDGRSRRTTADATRGPRCRPGDGGRCGR